MLRVNLHIRSYILLKLKPCMEIYTNIIAHLFVTLLKVLKTRQFSYFHIKITTLSRSVMILVMCVEE